MTTRSAAAALDNSKSIELIREESRDSFTNGRIIVAAKRLVCARGNPILFFFFFFFFCTLRQNQETLGSVCSPLLLLFSRPAVRDQWANCSFVTEGKLAHTKSFRKISFLICWAAREPDTRCLRASHTKQELHDESRWHSSSSLFLIQPVREEI